MSHRPATAIHLAGLRKTCLAPNGAGKSTLIGIPAVLAPDEPIAGLDIELREQLRRMVRSLNAADTAILLTTHCLEEAEALCDRIAVIGEGRLIARDTSRDLIARMDGNALAVTLDRELERAPPCAAQPNTAMPCASAGLDEQ